MKNEKWKQQAMFLFFVEKESVSKISKTIGVSRRSVGEYLGGLPGYAKEREERVKENRARYKQYQRDWDRANRAGRYGGITGETLRREHELAVSILSHEKYYGD